MEEMTMSGKTEKITLSDGEWKIMNLLWEAPPKTVMQLTKELQAETGWGKNTVITMVKRLEAKNAVRHEEGERAKLFYPRIPRDEAALEETRGFLKRVYEGSFSMMVHSMVSSKALSKKDIEELYAILDKAEEEVRDE